MDEISAPDKPLDILLRTGQEGQDRLQCYRRREECRHGLAQARMAIEHPIFDPEANRKVLLDHLFLISAGEITRAARTWLVEQLDAGQRRHIIFMDRDELLDQSARILLDLCVDSPPIISDEDIPF
ncbi:MAG: hypothetical protein ACRD8A_04025 [Candidatus Acidiferrales bacterium]